MMAHMVTSLVMFQCHQVHREPIFWGLSPFTKKAKQHKNVAQMDKRVGWKILQDDFLKTVLQIMLSLLVITPFLFDMSCC